MASVLVLFAHPAFQRSRVNRALVAPFEPAALDEASKRYKMWLSRSGCHLPEKADERSVAI